MQRTSSLLISISIFLLLIASCNNQKKTPTSTFSDYSSSWQSVDSLNKLGQYASARSIVEEIKLHAQNDGDWKQEYKAWMHSAMQAQRKGEELPSILDELNARADSAVFPLQQLLYSVAGEQTWNHYQQNRWIVLDRKNTAGDPGDMRTWGQQRYIDATLRHFKASLQERERSKEMSSTRLDELLNPGDPLIRPSLYDILAHRALVFYSSSESRLAEPAWRYRMEAEQDFELYEGFALRKITHRDSSSLALNAMNLYKDLTHIHIKDDEESALIHLDLQRLKFVHGNSQHPKKDSLYLEALKTMQSRVKDHPGSADISFELASWHRGSASKYDRLGGDAYKWEKKKALAICDDAISRFPESVGGKNCARLKHDLLNTTLSISLENAVLPNADFPISIGSVNTNKVQLRIHELKRELEAEERYYGDQIKKLLSRPLVREWSQKLQDDGDMNQHFLELITEGLPFGKYAVVASATNGFKYEKDVMSYAVFWVTELGIASRVNHLNEQEINVLSRKNGAPLSDVTIQQYRWKNNRRNNGFELKKTALSLGKDANRLARSETYYYRGERYRFTRGDDIYICDLSGYGRGDQEAQERTHLFLDRSIYRPGQDIHFKGIMIKGSHNDHRILSDRSTMVMLMDVNHQKVAEVQVVSDEFGAFSGTFTAPAGLTGSMHIKTSNGQRFFRVEEYKRPKFEVVMDPLEGQQRLGEMVTATGKANSYSGVPIDGGSVQWKVSRSARRPWWCWGWFSWGLPWGQDTEIANGLAETDSEGSFSIEFEALPDPVFPKDADPFFDYKIEASVTDINGETQSGTSSLSLSHKSIRIELDLPEVIWKDDFKRFNIDVKNMNDQHVDADLDIKVVKLQQPGNAIKFRHWEKPDRFLLSEDEFKERLPFDVYKDESDPLNWGLEKEYIDVKGWKAHGQDFTIERPNSWKAGTYLIGINTKDDQGQKVAVRKAFTVLEKKNGVSAVPAMLRVDQVKTSVQPGEKAQLLLSSSMPQAEVLLEVERNGNIARREWILLENEQRLIEFDCKETDRGGFQVHLVNFSEGRNNTHSIAIDVPWSNKELQFEWMSFRDKLLPSVDEEWRLRVKGDKGNKVSAQLLALMYDASLDQFTPHDIDLQVWTNNRSSLGYNQSLPFGQANSMVARRRIESPSGGHYTVPSLNTYGFTSYGRYELNSIEVTSNRGGFRLPRLAGAVAKQRRSSADGWAYDMDAEGAFEAEADNVGYMDSGNVSFGGVPAITGDIIAQTAPPPVIRSDFRETAFFFPDLLTDRTGNTVLRFKTPEALTRWKVLGLAHTKELAIGKFTKETVTQKPLMVTPNLPRFFRELDKITITSKISALEDRMEGLASLELFDPFTNKSIDADFGYNGIEQTFVCSPGESAVVEWALNIPDDHDAVSVRIVARTKNGPRNNVSAADGEEHVLPILSDRILVTESLPIAVRTRGTHEFIFDKLLNNSSSTLKHKALTLEYTPNPAWYAVQALPYIMEFPHECAEQTFSRYYANALASHITKKKPAIQKIFNEWKDQGSDALLSNLEKNQELKNILIEETPWLLEARNESDQKKRIGILFDMKRMAAEESKAISKLKEMQSSEGGWPWFPGMLPSRSVTQHILSGLGHLEKLGVAKFTGATNEHRMIEQAVRWLDKEAAKDFRQMKKWNKNWKEMRPGFWDIQYLYARSFFPQWELSAGAKDAAKFYKERIAKEWLKYGLQEQGMIAMVLHRDKDENVPGLILKSLKERATMHEELGMYWKGFKGGYAWNSFPIETHAMLIECFNEVTQDNEAVKELRVYLLKLKQTTNWKTTKATAQACYALLLGGEDWLKPMPLPTIELGDVVLKNGMKGLEAEAGTGYIKRSWQNDDVKTNMGNIAVTTKNDGMSWGAVHWQYLEQMDKVTPHEETPFTIKKDIMLKKPSDEGDVLIKVKEAAEVKPGDVLTIRIELRTDRHLDNVHMKDLRGSGLEPIEKLSGYKYQGGLGYYQSIKDAAMHFFFDRISPGTYVFEYDLRVTHEGDFSNGITTAMCMYAPEFNSHSSGERVEVVAQ